MDEKKTQWILLVLIGVLLGLLAAVLVWRWRGTLSLRKEDAPPPTVAPTATAPELTPAPTPEPAPAPTPEPPVGEALVAFAGSHPGRWSLCWMRLPDGEPVYVATDNEPMVSASLIKLFIMGAVYERLEQGTLTHEAVDAKLFAMITISDNASANELIRLLGDGDAEAGMAAVNDWCARQGYADTRLNRLMLAENGLQNYTSAIDCARFLAAVYRGECVSEAASREMLALLLQQTVNDRLPVKLPPGTRVAHKTGDLVGLCWADVGIVFSPGGDYVLCVISDGAASERDAKDATAALSAEVYTLVNPS